MPGVVVTALSAGTLSPAPAGVAATMATDAGAVGPGRATPTGPDAALSGGGEGAAGTPVDAGCCANAKLTIAPQNRTAINVRFI